MFKHELLYASKRTSGIILVIVVLISQISCKCIKNAEPKPKPQPLPSPWVEEEPVRQTRMPHPHRLTCPPFPSGSIEPDESDLKSGENREKRDVQRAMQKNNIQDFEYDGKMINPYDMGGRPPPGKTERRKRKTAEMAATVVIRYKRGVTPDIMGVNERKKKIMRVRRELDSQGHEETLRKRNKIDDHKRKSFISWMSKVVPEHASHVQKLHSKGVEKLMEQRVHGMEKTYGELFHEHHEKTQRESKLKGEKHDLHHSEHHAEEHEPHHVELHAEHDPHHVELHGEHEPHHYEMHGEGHHDLHDTHHLEIHDGEHNPHHAEMHNEHLEKEKMAHLKEAELEEHNRKAHKNLLEEMYLKEGKKPHETKDKHELEEEEHEEVPQTQPAAAQVQQQAQQQQQQQQQQQYQQQQLYQQQQYQQQQYPQNNNYNNYGGGQGGMGGGMGMNGMGGMGMNGMGGMGMNGMGGMGMNGMGMNGMGMGQMGGMGAIINAIGNNLPKLSQPAAGAAQAPGGQPNYPQQTQQSYPQNYGGQNYPSPAANGPDPNIQNAQDAAAAQAKAAQDQEAQVPQPDTQDSTAIQDKDQDTSADSSANVKGGDDGSDDDIKAANSDDAQSQSENTINGQLDNGVQDNEQNPQFNNMQQNPQFDNAQLGQYNPYAQNSVQNMAAAAGK